MTGAAEKSVAESRDRGSPSNSEVQGGVHAAPLIAPAQCPSGAPSPRPTTEDLLVSRQPFSREANQRAPLARPSPSASRRKDPVGAGSALPCPALPGEAGLGAGAGAGAAGGGVVRPYKNEGGGGPEAHLVPLPGGPGDRAAPAGGLPTPRTCVCRLLSRRTGESRAPLLQRGEDAAAPARSALGGPSPPSGAQVLAEPLGAAGAGGGADRCRDPVPPSPAAPSLAAALRPPSPWAPARRSETELQLSRDFGPGLANLASSCSARVRRAARWPGAARRPQGTRWEPWGSRPESAGAPAPLPRVQPLGLAPALPPARPPSPAHAARIRVRRFGEAQLAGAAARGLVSGWGGREGGVPPPRPGARALAETAHVSWTRTSLWTP